MLKAILRELSLKTQRPGRKAIQFSLGRPCKLPGLTTLGRVTPVSGPFLDKTDPGFRLFDTCPVDIYRWPRIKDA